MKPEGASTLEEWEAQVRATAVSKHREELGLLEKLLKLYLDGFGRIGKFTLGEDNELEYAWLLLITRSFNSLRCAFDLLQKGYYTQAGMLIRGVEEDWLTAVDCQIYPKTLKALLKGEGKLGKDDLRFSEMAKRMAKKGLDEKVWKANYGQVSEIAHPRQMALRILVDPDTNDLQLGGQYQGTLFVSICHALMRAAVIMTVFMVELLGESGTQWQSEHLDTIQAATAYVERMSKEAQSN